MSEDLLAGRNPVLEAMRANRPLTKIAVARGAHGGPLAEVVSMARTRGIPIQEVTRERLDQWAGGLNHQGILAWGAAREYVELDELVAGASASGEDPLLVLLDGLEDPHNLGSVLRSADAAGVHGVVIPKHRAVGLTSTVARTSAGAVEHVPVARVTNLVRAIEDLKAAGLWIVGADQEADDVYFSARLTGPLAMVIGGEGKGLSRLVRESCDFLVRLPMQGQVNSLNAGVAAALLMYEVRRQRTP